MKGATYTVSGTQTSGIIWKFTYNLDGLLSKFEFLEGDMTPVMIQWLFQKGYFPFKEEMIETFKQRKDLTVEIGDPDLSFDRFWNTYAKKQKKIVTEKLWKKLSDQNRLAAINGIKKYKTICRMNNHGQALPDTYLSQQRWLDEM